MATIFVIFLSRSEQNNAGPNIDLMNGKLLIFS
jgi:hypothetical protein